MAQSYDVLIRNGSLYDGTGAPPVQADLAISGDRIVAVGGHLTARGRIEIEAGGKAVAPGFINMLSWSTESLIEDGQSQSEIRQAVTLQVMGEGWSMGPLNETMKSEVQPPPARLRDVRPFARSLHPGTADHHTPGRDPAVDIASGG
ncbi:MAG: hypothetical protein A2W35_12270 [Chloroflexi bacterium RBG_16_57_11]|nr:MAG: hypothetical protein A2W35_12270 [Chloroflexi bacterium RBG_16_57_11]